MHALNPVQRVGHQIAEPIRLHEKSVSEPTARARVGDLLEQVGYRPAWPSPTRTNGVRRSEAAGHDRHGAGLRTGPSWPMSPRPPWT